MTQQASFPPNVNVEQANVDTNNSSSSASGISNLLIQQRQILAMMNVDIWVGRDCETQIVDYDATLATVNSPTEQAVDATLSVDEGRIAANGEKNKSAYHSGVNVAAASPVIDNENIPNSADDEAESSAFQDFIDEHSNDKSVNQPVLDSNNARTVTEKNSSNSKASEAQISPQQIKQVTSKVAVAKQVAPFQLLAAKYKGWVLLVDAQSLQNSQMFKLWQNILSGLSLNEDSLQFPICEGINDLESANASVAGFIFRIARNDTSPLAALTPMPDGIDHDRLIRVPYLSEMLTDSRQKRQLWKLLNDDDVASMK